MAPYRIYCRGDRRNGPGIPVQSKLALLEANRLLGLAEELASLGSWHIDPDSLLVERSAQASVILSVAGDQPLSIAMIIERIAPEHRFGFLRGMVRAFRAQAGKMCRIRFTTTQGIVRTLVVNAQRDDDAGRKPRLFGIVQDISKQDEVERSLIAARDVADAATRAKSDFLAAMSHEIRTPMTGILGMLDLLAEVESPEERDQYLAAMRQSAHTLMAVLDGVLDFSKIEAGRIALNCREFDLPNLVRQTVLVFQSAASQKGVSLDLEIDPGASPLVVGDPLRIQQVLGNFISNAAKFTDSGRIEVSLRARPGRSGSQRWTFAVSDTGVGIDSTEVERLFEPFVQVGDRSLGGGTGLGLAISSRIIAAMGGQAKVKSKKGRGSTFSFALELPMANGATAAAEPAAGAEPAASRALSILIAEDNAISQMLVATLMRRKGHRVTCVDNGRRAIESALAMPFDCILMDMQMPEVDGIQATRTIRESGGRNAIIPIIALTADAVPERRRFYENIGLSGFLTKPVDREALDQAIGAIAAAPPVREIRTPPIPALDFKQIEELEAAIGKKKLNKLLDMACAELTARPAAMRGLVDGDDLAVLRKEAHSFKGAVSSLGLVAAARAAKAVELALPGAELEHSLERLESEANRALLAVRSLLADDTSRMAAAGG
jgi:signal transduction histidine kinase/CheY-like chemotaxis protein/HPt (histidine-containing phosphotransfer) domain-containing protein